MAEFYLMTADPQALERDKGDKSHIKAVIVKDGGASFVPQLYEALGIDAREAGTAIIVDDTPLMRKLVERAMTNKGWEVHGYDNPVEALDAYPRLRLDLVISDNQMPSMTGLEMTRKMSEYGTKK